MKSLILYCVGLIILATITAFVFVFVGSKAVVFGLCAVVSFTVMHWLAEVRTTQWRE
jgi:hypothetical protein